LAANGQRGLTFHPRSYLEGARFARYERRGKFLCFSLEGAAGETRTLSIHLRMSGSLHVMKQGEHLSHVRAELHLANGAKLLFRDPRKFGRMYIGDAVSHALDALGPEPFAPTLHRTFHSRLAMSDRRLKTLLLDQSMIAGIGNIYADEALWQARLHPLRRGSSLSPVEARSLLREIRRVLRAAIASQGTDFGDDVVCGFHEPLIYGHKGEPCPRCKAIIRQIRVNQRSTHYCPNCQRARGGN